MNLCTSIINSRSSECSSRWPKSIININWFLNWRPVSIKCLKRKIKSSTKSSFKNISIITYYRYIYCIRSRCCYRCSKLICINFRSKFLVNICLYPNILLFLIREKPINTSFLIVPYNKRICITFFESTCKCSIVKIILKVSPFLSPLWWSYR
jgi:hypothetical protein